MHTLLEYRAGKLTCHQRPSSRTNKLTDTVVDDDDGPMPTDRDHLDRLESVQLIRRASKTLRHIHANTDGHNGYASLDTNQRTDGAMMRMMMLDNASSSSSSTTARTNVVIGSATSTRPDAGSIHLGSNLGFGRLFQLSSGQIGASASMNGFSNGNHRQFVAATTSAARIHGELPMNSSQQLTTWTSPSSSSFGIEDDGRLPVRKTSENLLKKSQSLPLPTTTTTTTSVSDSSIRKIQPRIGFHKADGIRLSFWQDIGGVDDDDDDDRFFLKENKDDAGNNKDGNRTRIAAITATSAGTDSGDSFAGVRWLPERAICGATGTVRGMRHRVRAGIATFRQQTTRKYKNFNQLEAGKVVVYTTSAGIVRATFQHCLRVKTILSTLLVGFDEKDIFKCRAYQWELAERLRDDDGHDNVRIPQVFIEGYHLGNGEVIEQLNECGRLRKILRPYQRASANQVCHKCGGYLLLLCSACNGSKKSVTRNQFSGSLVPLRCIKCDECGLVPCDICCCCPEVSGKA